VPGVWKVAVNFEKKEARVEYDANLCEVYDMGTALAGIGYEGGLKSE
jgi:copper chaperone CopZ